MQHELLHSDLLPLGKKIMFNTMIRIEMALSLALSFEFISQSKEISTVTYYCKLVEDGNACDSV